MISASKRIVHEVSSVAEPLLDSRGMEMVETEFLSEKGRWILRVFIDREGGVTLDDCAGVSRELGDIIEAKNIIGHPYVLEVSSPGLNRPLKKKRDFIQSIDKTVKVTMSQPINNRRNFTGRLVDVREAMIHLLLDDTNVVELPLEGIDRARLKYEYNK
ncbi:MAG: ribosome maturation factor RimP [Deltaproteobacteria bacterium]|nr:ribosome maturation factor RimP [Deltaproteobacteria bacterium]MBW2339466.1 ribosome maturation factor RimP [Deltaproteobacteria bacterium]